MARKYMNREKVLKCIRHMNIVLVVLSLVLADVEGLEMEDYFEKQLGPCKLQSDIT